MVPKNKIIEHEVSMAAFAHRAFRLTSSFIEKIMCGKSFIKERNLHDAFNCAIARHKRVIENSPRFLTRRKKEEEKETREFFLRTLENQLKSFLKSQNKLY